MNNNKPSEFHRSYTSGLLTYSQPHEVHTFHKTRGISCAIPTASKLIRIIEGVAVAGSKAVAVQGVTVGADLRVSSSP